MLLGAASAPAQKTGGRLPDGETILKNIEDRWEPVKDYSVTLEVVADIEKMDIAPMVVRMYYKQPDKMHFESEGFAVLPRDALRFNPHDLRSRFNAEGVSRDSSDGHYRVKLISRGETTPVRRLTMIVDPGTFTIDGLESATADGRHMKATFTHTKIGEILLPSSLVVEFTSDAPPETPSPDVAQAPGRPPRRGRVTLTFKDYTLNSGLPDDLFKKKEE